MTDRKALKVIQTFLMDRICILKQRDEEQAKLIDEAWKVVRRAALEAENRLSDERSSTAWMNMPEAEDKTETERLADRTMNMVEELYEKIVKLQGNLCQVEKQVTQNETEVAMLWNETERLKSKMPKEWVIAEQGWRGLSINETD